VTGVTLDSEMYAVQFVFCVSIMIKDNVFPFIFVMTFFAFISIASCMDIINAMAGHAGSGQILIVLVRVAAVTAGLFMFSM